MQYKTLYVDHLQAFYHPDMADTLFSRCKTLLKILRSFHHLKLSSKYSTSLHPSANISTLAFRA
jgi:inhibitor of KinA sporulation pathway (predicted exonuclease)